MQKSVSVDSVVQALPPIYIGKWVVKTTNGKSYDISRCSCQREVYRVLRMNGIDAKQVVSVDYVVWSPPKRDWQNKKVW